LDGLGADGDGSGKIDDGGYDDWVAILDRTAIAVSTLNNAAVPGLKPRRCSPQVR
jgi:hypothetical protein